ncbi:glycosyltransferase family 2 protein [Paenibacillus sp. FSL H8-0261]|uniref:glycosyltransferase n=1 Tax=Paenibacillus sp. FSL H8-0261 TaxID=2921381 RepID=UPI003246E010
MITISLCMIVKNEEEILPRCLASVKGLVDEIVVVDTGSSDRTIDIARSLGAVVYEYKWQDDFSAARNYAFAQGTSDYLFWLDADDVLEEDDASKLMSLKNSITPDYDSITMDYILSISENGQPLNRLKRNRLVRRDRMFQWIGYVHEYLAVSGRIFHSDIAVTHKKVRAYSDRNLQLYLRKRERGFPFSERDQYYFGNELLDNGRVSEAAEQYELFLALEQGWIEDKIAACHKLADCYGQLEQPEQQKFSLLRSLNYDAPRADFCCKLGNIFLEQMMYGTAIYWFRQATLMEPPSDAMNLVDLSYWTWLPHLQLCVSYDRLGEHAKAKYHHEWCKVHYPNHPSIIYNEAYFAELVDNPG